MLDRLKREYLEEIEEKANEARPMVALVREWSQIQKEVMDISEAGSIDAEEADRFLDELFPFIDSRLAQLGEEEGPGEES